MVQAGGKRQREIADILGITLSAMDAYEQAGLVRPAHDSAGKLYSEGDERRFRIIMKATALGFTLDEIARLLEAVR